MPLNICSDHITRSEPNNWHCKLQSRNQQLTKSVWEESTSDYHLNYKQQLNSIQQIQLQMMTEITLLKKPISCSSGRQVTMGSSSTYKLSDRETKSYSKARGSNSAVSGPSDHFWEPTFLFYSLTYRSVLCFMTISMPMIFNMYKSRKWQEEKAYDYNSFIQQILIECTWHCSKDWLEKK